MNYDHYEDGVRTIKTATNYEYKIVLDRTMGLWEITTSSGSVPQRLTGTYTSAAEAAKAIKNYQDIPRAQKGK